MKFFEKIVLFDEQSRELALAEATQQANETAISAGAHPATLQTVEVEEIPLAYYPGNAVRLRLKVVGTLR